MMTESPAMTAALADEKAAAMAGHAALHLAALVRLDVASTAIGEDSEQSTSLEKIAKLLALPD